MTQKGRPPHHQSGDRLRSALAHEGVVAVLDHTNAPRLHVNGDSDDDPDRELMVLQDDRIDVRGQVVALVLAGTLEAAREGAALVEVSYAAEPHEAELRPGAES